ncbi:MAG: HNH endonuclease signature motif containing protein [Candidatus Paceibacterota bacterium]
MNDDQKYNSEYIKRRYVYLKEMAVEYKGGKCEICGYNKCIGALVFHHKDPLNKKFSWHHMRKRSLETMKEELDKCQLLCANCHSEIHFNSDKSNEYSKWIRNKKNSKKNTKRGTTSVCEHCGCSFPVKRNGHRYCSIKCCQLDHQKVCWPTHNELMKLIKDNSILGVSKMFGVSFQTVKKHIRNGKKCV